MFKRKDWLVIVVALLLAVGVFMLTRGGFQLGLPGEDDPMRVLKEISTPSGANPSAGEQGNPQSYLVLTVGDTRYRPLPLYSEATYSLHQSNGRDNVIHVSKDSVYMESASCDNQECVKQGTVSLDNKDTRVLNNMIICLPNQVVLELMTPEEARVGTQ